MHRIASTDQWTIARFQLRNARWHNLPAAACGRGPRRRAAGRPARRARRERACCVGVHAFGGSWSDGCALLVRSREPQDELVHTLPRARVQGGHACVGGAGYGGEHAITCGFERRPCTAQSMIVSHMSHPDPEDLGTFRDTAAVWCLDIQTDSDVYRQTFSW